MTVSKLLEKTRSGTIGDKPVVVLPLATWREVENRLEDLEMYQSVELPKLIAKAREEKNYYSAAEVKKLLRACAICGYGVPLQADRAQAGEKVAGECSAAHFGET